MTSGVSLYLSSLNGLPSALWYASGLVGRGARVFLCVPPDLLEHVESSALDPAVEVRTVAPLSSKERERARMHRSFVDYLSGLAPGDNPANLRYYGPEGAVRSALYRALRRTVGRVPSRTVNGWASRLFDRAVEWRFPTRHVVVVSFPGEPILLCDRRAQVDTVVDSWDHPVRRACGYATGTAVAWNPDLGRDWVTYQGADDTALGPPIKLRYALEHQGDGRADGEKVLMYPMVTSRYARGWFDDELEVLATVLSSARDAGWQVLVKPKPVSSPEELAGVVGRFDNATLGTFTTSHSSLDYLLTDEYNAKRLRELDEVALVVNSGTTFGLDAACAGRPLLQLDLSGLEDAKAFADANGNYHIQNHLCRVARPAGRPRSLRELGAQLARELAPAARAKHVADARRLRDWVSHPAEAFDETLDHLAGTARGGTPRGARAA